MSDPLRIAIAVEGPTDAIILKAVLDALLPVTDFEVQTLQPETSAAFATTGTGWVGVYRWSRQSVSEGGGSVSGSSVFKYHDLLIVQVDADVAGKTYASGSIETWVLAAICPGNSIVKRKDWECRANPEGQLATLPTKQRFQKRPADYDARRDVVTAAWPKVAARLTEAARFDKEFRNALADHLESLR